MSGTTDVLICGAGAAGLTLAVDLARRGVAFRIIEKAPEPFHGSRGKGIQPRSQEVFEDLGVIDRLVARGGVYPPQRSYSADGGHVDAAMMELADPTPAEPYQIPLLAPQFITEGVLRERLAELGHAVEFGRELLDFEQDDSGVTAGVAAPDGEEAVRARYLIGADGGRSFVRGALRIDFPGKTLGIRAIVADVMLQGLSRDAWHRFNEGSMAEQLAICPLAGTDLFQIQAPIPLEGDIDLSADGLAEMVASRTGRADIEVRSVSWASAYNMNARLADRYRDGRVFLVGDAAHIHPPTGGQGLNTSLQDSYNLAWKLGAVLAGAPPALLDTFEEERRPIAASVLGLSTQILATGSQRRGREVHQLDLGYLESSLSLEAPARGGGVLAGDRAPDAPIRGAGGLPTRVFRLLQGPHWTLLGFGVGPDLAIAPRANLHIHRFGPRGDIVDDAGHFRAAYGARDGDWFLVRPDGYTGAIVSSARLADLEAYLDRVGLLTPAPEAARHSGATPIPAN